MKQRDDASQKNMSGKTFRAVAEEWLDFIRDKVARTTHDRYSDALIRDIYPEYEDSPIEKITFEEINRFTKIAPELAMKRGRTLKESGLQIVRTIMTNVMQFTSDPEYGKAGIPRTIESYEELIPQEIETICFRAKYNHCPEMLAALLSMYCGLRTGELSGLSSDDVDLERMEIYIHSTVHRVKNPDENAIKKTHIVVEELPRKNQIRRVSIPGVLKEYIAEFIIPGKPMIRAKDDESLSDPRSLENRLLKVMELFGIKNINFERLRKTYLKEKADLQILNNVFQGIRPNKPYSGAIDVNWMTVEMTKDLASLRLLLGLDRKEMGSILGVTEGKYKSLENGTHEISWNQYLTLLFMFYYNGKTKDVVEPLGLFPSALQERIRIG